MAHLSLPPSSAWEHHLSLGYSLPDPPCIYVHMYVLAAIEDTQHCRGSFLVRLLSRIEITPFIQFGNLFPNHSTHLRGLSGLECL